MRSTCSASVARSACEPPLEPPTRLSCHASAMPHVSCSPLSSRTQQCGGTLLGLIIGLVVGLAVALAAALYVTKAPLPFMNRFQQRPSTAGSDASNWNPNKNLSGSGAPPAAISGNGTPQAVGSAPLSPKALENLGLPPGGVMKAQGNVQAPAPTAVPVPAPPLPSAGASAVPHAEVAPAFEYIVQIGAYGNRGDAEAQRAKVALSGLEAHIDTRTVGDRTLYRVRVGPFPTADQADRAQRSLSDNGIGSAVVKTPK